MEFFVYCAAGFALGHVVIIAGHLTHNALEAWVREMHEADVARG